MPLKVKVTPPREGGGRVMSATDASTAKSTPPKTGTDADIQRVNNMIQSLSKNLSKASIRSLFDKALKTQGSGSDAETLKKAAKKDPPNYQGKAYGGKTKKMAMGGKTYSNGVRKPMAMGGKARKK